MKFTNLDLSQIDMTGESKEEVGEFLANMLDEKGTEVLAEKLKVMFNKIEDDELKTPVDVLLYLYPLLTKEEAMTFFMMTTMRYVNDKLEKTLMTKFIKEILKN